MGRSNRADITAHITIGICGVIVDVLRRILHAAGLVRAGSVGTLVPVIGRILAPIAVGMGMGSIVSRHIQRENHGVAIAAVIGISNFVRTCVNGQDVAADRAAVPHACPAHIKAAGQLGKIKCTVGAGFNGIGVFCRPKLV